MKKRRVIEAHRLSFVVPQSYLLPKSFPKLKINFEHIPHRQLAYGVAFRIGQVRTETDPAVGRLRLQQFQRHGNNDSVGGEFKKWLGITNADGLTPDGH